MTKNKRKIITIILLIISLLLMINPITNATIDPDVYNPSKNPLSDSDVKKMTNLAKPIIDAISVVGIVLSVITLAIIGIKYMTGSVSEKAEYKKTMIPYLIGVVLLVAVTQFLRVIASLVSTVKV